MKFFKNFIFTVFSLTLLVYMMLPGSYSISNFPTLPNSSKSTLSGDTVQVPNLVAYYSDNFRDFVTDFYYQSYKQKNLFPFNPIRLNYPPEFAYQAIKDQTQSTYLEEYTYPLRDSVFVNGMEPFNSDGTSRFIGSDKFEADGKTFYTKTTIRYYPSSYPVRFIAWVGIIASTYLIFKIGGRVLSNA